MDNHNYQCFGLVLPYRDIHNKPQESHQLVVYAHRKTFEDRIDRSSKVYLPLIQFPPSLCMTHEEMVVFKECIYGQRYNMVQAILARVDVKHGTLLNVADFDYESVVNYTVEQNSKWSSVQYL